MSEDNEMARTNSSQPHAVSVHLPVRGLGYLIDRDRELLHVAAVHGSELGRVPVGGSGHGV
jgi:hypothetical protein